MFEIENFLIVVAVALALITFIAGSSPTSLWERRPVMERMTTMIGVAAAM